MIMCILACSLYRHIKLLSFRMKYRNKEKNIPVVLQEGLIIIKYFKLAITFSKTI